MPNEDRADFQRRGDLVVAANAEAPYIQLLCECIAGLEAAYELISTRRRLGECLRAVGVYLRETTRELVTEIDH
jgi:hypothetical protein